ncbi:MAG TPA: two-component system sensor histidine kinase CreC [Polyangiales bacterium]|nr:two-component system sensor histidine kinase CreC [Polyangiales bacterium]
MKLGTLLFAAVVAIVVLCFSYPVWVIANNLRLVYLESAEEPLVDTANVLAELVGMNLERDPELAIEVLYDTAGRIGARRVNAKIYEVLKQGVDLDLYIADAQGKLVFDSRGRENIGADYKSWRDVYRTLHGTYGARVGNNPRDPNLPRLLYVGAPIYVRGTLAGSLTLIKPTTAVNAFLHKVRPRLYALGALALGSSIALALLVSLWITQQVGRLTHYADQVREGRRVPFPDLAPTELRRMGLAFEKMRESLAGQTYIEQYVRALTHEIKSPISAIRGAAEILETPSLSDEQRARFLGNVRDETLRIQDLVDRMLELSELEVRRALPKRERVELGPIVRTILEAQEASLSRRGLRCELSLPEELVVQGDAFLLHLALSNLLKNAVEFSPAGGTIRVDGRREAACVWVSIEDQGPGIPAFAKERIFERFYSLERPDTGRKSTGLGLNFVKEIAALHHGRVELQNLPERGLAARFEIALESRAAKRGPPL